MTLRSWYKIVLFLPVWLPLIAALFVLISTGDVSLLRTPDESALRASLHSAELLYVASLVGLAFGGGQYIVFGCVMLWFLTRKPTRAWFSYFRWLPFYFAPFFQLPLLGWLVTDFDGLGLLFAAEVMYGYICVALMWILTRAALLTGLVRAEAA